MAPSIKLDDEYTVWKLRITKLERVDNARITDLCAGLDGTYFMVEETDKANRPHYQGVLVSRMNVVTLRARIKTAFPGNVGNDGYSLKKSDDPPAYQRYLCKGAKGVPPDVVCRRGYTYTVSWFKEQHEAFWADERAEAYEFKKAKLSANARVWEKVALLPEVTPLKVFRLIVDTYTMAGKSYDVLVARKFCNVIMSKYDKNFRKHMVQAMLADDLYSGYYAGDGELTQEEHGMLEFEF